MNDIQRQRILTLSAPGTPNAPGLRALEQLLACDSVPAWMERELQLLLQPLDPARVSDDLECVLRVGDHSGFAAEWVPALATRDGHHSHFELVRILSDTKDSRVVPTLVGLVLWTPPYLAWDDHRALARAALHGLERTPKDAATAALVRMQAVTDPALSALAQRLLERRHSAGRLYVDPTGGDSCARN